MNAVRLSHAEPVVNATHESALGERVRDCVRRYLTDLDNAECGEGLYELVMREVERPLLREVMAWHDQNQSRAAATLGINRATLRKKLIQHGLT